MIVQQSSIVLINGASSAGKSTLAKAFQAQVDVPFLRFSLDLLMFGGEVLPTQRDGGAFSWTAMRPRLVDGYYGCLAALASAGNNLVVDTIIETEAERDRLFHTLKPFDVTYVALHCPLPELKRRERQRGDRRIGDAVRDYAFVNQVGPYDIELKSITPAEANATCLIAAWKARCGPVVFEAWAARQQS